MNKDLLIKELIEAGAEEAEAEQLASFARTLHLSTPLRSKATQLYQFALINKQLEKRTFSFNLPRFFAPLSLGLASLFSVVSVGAYAAEKSLPGEPLYQVKIAGESIIGGLSKQYRSEAPIRRSEEVKNLITSHQSQDKIQKGLEEYKKEISSNREATSNEVIERSHRNLQEAQTQATETVKEEIKQTLDEGSVKGIEHRDNENKSNSETPNQKQKE